MTTYQKLTALEMLADCASTSATAAFRHRHAATERKQTDMGSYREGEAAAYTYAHQIMKDEIARLRNLYQNGALSLDAFKTH